MTLHSRVRTHTLVALLSIACLGLVLVGCDSGGSDPPEPTAFTVTIENVGSAAPILKSGAFTPSDESTGNNEPPLTPGEAFQFSFTAGPNEVPGSGMVFSFATMFVQSNDLFYAFQPSGLALFDANGQPVSGDVTDQVMLYDAGTEGDQEPGVGLDQVPRQSSGNTGPSGEGNITQVNGNNNGFSYPAPSDIIRVTITPPSQ